MKVRSFWFIILALSCLAVFVASKILREGMLSKMALFFTALSLYGFFSVRKEKTE